MKHTRCQLRLFAVCTIVLMLTVPLLVTPVHAGNGRTISMQAPPADPPPHMDFQPPPDADDITDFVPPGLELVRDNPGQGRQASAHLNAGQGRVFAYNDDKFAAVIEGDTFPGRSRIRFQEITVPGRGNGGGGGTAVLP